MARHSFKLRGHFFLMLALISKPDRQLIILQVSQIFDFGNRQALPAIFFLFYTFAWASSDLKHLCRLCFLSSLTWAMSCSSKSSSSTNILRNLTTTSWFSWLAAAAQSAVYVAKLNWDSKLIGILKTSSLVSFVSYHKCAAIFHWDDNKSTLHKSKLLTSSLIFVQSAVYMKMQRSPAALRGQNWDFDTERQITAERKTTHDDEFTQPWT